MLSHCLEVEKLHVRLGGSYVLQGLSLQVPQGRTVVVLGRNGVGKTTLLRTLMGLCTDVQVQSLTLKGEDMTHWSVEQRAHQGLSYVPQGRRIFPSLSVEENLLVASRPDPSGETIWDLEKVYEVFPILKERSRYPGTSLSGGQQQQLAIARALVSNPYVLLLDEPTEGLAPIMVQRVAETIQMLKRAHLALVLVEQNTAFSIPLADEVYIMHRGQFVFHGTPGDLERHPEIKEQYLGVS